MTSRKADLHHGGHPTLRRLPRRYLCNLQTPHPGQSLIGGTSDPSCATIEDAGRDLRIGSRPVCRLLGAPANCSRPPFTEEYALPPHRPDPIKVQANPTGTGPSFSPSAYCRGGTSGGGFRVVCKLQAEVDP